MDQNNTETATRMVPGTCRAKKHKRLDFLDTLLGRDGERVEKLPLVEMLREREA